MVCDWQSEEESRYLAENSYLPKYSSMRNGAICMEKVSQYARQGVESQIASADWDRIEPSRRNTNASYDRDDAGCRNFAGDKLASEKWGNFRQELLGQAGMRIGGSYRHGALRT